MRISIFLCFILSYFPKSIGVQCGKVVGFPRYNLSLSNDYIYEIWPLVSFSKC